MTSTLSKFPESAPVYKIVNSTMTEAYIKDLGIKFGFSGEVFENSEFYSMSNEQTQEFLSVYKASGRISYQKSLTIDKNLSLPTYEEAANIAVNKLKETALLPAGDVTTKVISGGSFDLIVYVQFPVEVSPFGGDKISLRIGNLGQVTQINASTAKYEQYKTVKLKSVNQAFQELKKTRTKYCGMDSIWVSINNISLSYWSEPSPRIKQEFLFPVYIFKGNKYHSLPIFDKNPGYYTGWIDASNESAIDFPGLLGVLGNNETPYAKVTNFYEINYICK